MEGHGRYFRCGTDHYGDRISAWKDWKITDKKREHPLKNGRGCSRFLSFPNLVTVLQ